MIKSCMKFLQKNILTRSANKYFKEATTMITSYSRGWEIYYDGKDWRYSDNNQIHDNSRPCKRCGRMPTAEGYDACIGHIDGAVSACCGHGVEDPYVKND